MTAAVAMRPRTLAHVLLEVADAQNAFNRTWIKPCEGIELVCLDRLDALQDEARAMIENATGVSWMAISAAYL